MALVSPQSSSPSPLRPARPGSGAPAVVAALSVYIEPLVPDARVAVVGDGELGLHERLLELGARTVHLYDPDPNRVARIADEVPRGVSVRMLRDDFDVRDSAFDLVVIPDMGLLPNGAAAIVRLRRIVDPRGAVVAMGRARTAASDPSVFAELAPAAVEYAELYDLFALQFESVTMTAVLPFGGVVFAELGAGDDLAVSVDTRLVEPEPPGVFVVVAGREPSSLDPYAIVQVNGELARGADVSGTAAIAIPSGAALLVSVQSREQELVTALAAMQLKAELLGVQLEEQRARLASVDRVAADYESRFERLVLERDAVTSRAAELESLVVAAQQGLSLLERRLLDAEEALLERDDQIAALNTELDSCETQSNELTRERTESGPVTEVLGRAERAEASLARHHEQVAHVSEAHANEIESLEEQLRERARVVADQETELARRDQLVRELVTALDEARDAHVGPLAAPRFESVPVVPGVAPHEVARLRRKLDDLALEVARRDGELVAQAWRIDELEREKEQLAARVAPPAPAPASARAEGGVDVDLERELARARDEVDALRQALIQEHAARVAAQSGEEQISDRGTHPEG